MNDLQRFVELYRSFGIELQSYPDENGGQCITMGLDRHSPECNQSVKFDGWPGFYNEVIFDSEGTFVQQRFIE